MLVTPDDAEWSRFQAMSARIGGDLALVQGAGGNTSIKRDGVLWVKASGTWLAEAETRPIMVPVDLGRVQAAVADRSLAEADIVGMTLGGTLRASVETPFHAVIPGLCVVHVHCVATLAVAIRPDAEVVLKAALQGLDWGFMPYLKPGVPLTFALVQAGLHRRRVIVLGNHGLIVSGQTPDEAEALLREVQGRLSRPQGAAMAFAGAFDLDETGYRLARHGHDLARDPRLLRLATAGALAPDFVVFFGPALPVALTPKDLQGLAAAPLPLNSVVLVPGQGALIRADAMRGTEEILWGLAATLSQFQGDRPQGLTSAQVAELTSWEAEAYRQSQNRGSR